MAMNNYSGKIDDLMTLYKDSSVFQVLVDNTIAQKYKEAWWKEKFDLADMPLALTADGAATFKAFEVVEASSPMLNPRAQWAPPKESSKEGATYYIDSIWDWGTSFSLTPQEQAYYEKMLKTLNVPAVVLNKFLNTLDAKVKGAHATVSHISAQLLSKGEWESANTEGFKANGKCDKIESWQKVKAGTKAWSDVNADIRGKLIECVNTLRDKGEERPLVAMMDRDTFAYIQANTWFKENVGMIVVDGEIYNPKNPVTVEKYNTYVNVYSDGSLPFIEVIEEKQVLQNNSYTAKSDVRGWEAKSVVVAPIGKQGYIQYANVDEMAQLVQGIGDRSMAYLEGGLFGVLNWTEIGRSDRKITELLASFAPSLSNFKHMMWIDAGTANS